MTYTWPSSHHQQLECSDPSLLILLLSPCTTWKKLQQTILNRVFTLDPLVICPTHHQTTLLHCDQKVRKTDGNQATNESEICIQSHHLFPQNLCRMQSDSKSMNLLITQPTVHTFCWLPEIELLLDSRHTRLHIVWVKKKAASRHGNNFC